VTDSKSSQLQDKKFGARSIDTEMDQYAGKHRKSALKRATLVKFVKCKREEILSYKIPPTNVHCQEGSY
jgi:hypothetical protein